MLLTKKKQCEKKIIVEVGAETGLSIRDGC
jgi:hypothetical protein